jgi:hypothetical protein
MKNVKITPAQQKVLNYLNAQVSKSANLQYLQDAFHKTAIKNLIESGVLITEGQSRLRQDDMEMVYWTEIRVPTDADIVKQLIKA